MLLKEARVLTALVAPPSPVAPPEEPVSVPVAIRAPATCWIASAAVSVSVPLAEINPLWVMFPGTVPARPPRFATSVTLGAVTDPLTPCDPAVVMLMLFCAVTEPAIVSALASLSVKLLKDVLLSNCGVTSVNEFDVGSNSKTCVGAAKSGTGGVTVLFGGFNGTNYLGDAGASTAQTGGTTTFAVDVPANSTLLVTVYEITPNSSCGLYTLTVSTPTCLGPTSTPSPTPSSSPLDSEEWAFLTLINNFRAQNGAGALQVSAALSNSSHWMSSDMATATMSELLCRRPARGPAIRSPDDIMDADPQGARRTPRLPWWRCCR